MGRQGEGAGYHDHGEEFTPQVTKLYTWMAFELGPRTEEHRQQAPQPPVRRWIVQRCNNLLIYGSASNFHEQTTAVSSPHPPPQWGLDIISRRFFCAFLEKVLQFCAFTKDDLGRSAETFSFSFRDDLSGTGNRCQLSRGCRCWHYTYFLLQSVDRCVRQHPGVELSAEFYLAT